MKKVLAIIGILVATFNSYANNIQVSNVSIGEQNTVSHFQMINFDVSWENSWRTNTNENNYDGAWIFVKFRKQGTTAWHHATLTNTGNTTPAGSTLQVAIDGKGAWIYRNAVGAGNVNFAGGKLRWDYGTDGVADNDSVEVRMFALEMVYIPQGSFWLGSGGSETYHFKEGSTSNPYHVTSEVAITKGMATGNLNSAAIALSGSAIPAAFPKGYNAFWIMKYECSRQQYLDFLLCLDEARFNMRRPTGGFYTGVYPTITAVAPEYVVGDCNLNDWLAYADWAALRPFTELEYEKACRGANIIPVPNEYPWGNTTITPTTALLDNGTSYETAVNGNCNIAWGAGGNLIRSGIYATSTSDRTASGATYYGVMEMAGSVRENMIGVVNVAHLSFTGALHGDGNIDGNALTDIPTWTALISSSVTSQRGSSHNEPITYARTSDRISSTSTLNYNVRDVSYGIRVARTAE